MMPSLGTPLREVKKLALMIRLQDDSFFFLGSVCLFVGWFVGFFCIGKSGLYES